MVDKASLGGVYDRRDVASRPAWAGAGRWLFALLCVVVASLAGSASGRVSPAQIGAAQDTSPSVDAQRGAVRNPHAEIVAKAPIWRSGDAGGPQPGPYSAAIPAPRQSVAWLGGNELGSVSSDDREPHRLAVRAGYSRAPPTASGRFRTAA